jgi:single-strand DNA-binding protein
MPQNSVTITGNLADDPELRFTPTGQPVARFNVAYSERYIDKTTGEWKDGDTSYFTVIAWRELAEHVAESFIRGNRVIVTGKMQQRSWETREGDKRYSVEITADDIGASVKFAVAKITKAARIRPDGPGADPWQSASPDRPAPDTAAREPLDTVASPDTEPAPDGPHEPADGPADTAASDGNGRSGSRSRSRSRRGAA